MDINMPVMDGVAATALIKKRLPDIKIIMLTSYREVEYVLAACAIKRLPRRFFSVKGPLRITS
ncbi:response regulator [Paenibacillus campinasensis]|uniref:Response regulatory domain-containing protein n=1 Tax=Paenibacillus campinasensis TaxID=66347 RepID=A0A268ELW4_9BACL|nr:response regulator [Paenibacillus campinasensis]PAD74109.1 hypothetical protein CHH67_18570 [Paenibacillus campinasensis]